jgi:hypothetical protein
LTGDEAARIAGQCGVAEMAAFLYATDSKVLAALLANPNFGEREALLLLKRRNLPSLVIQELVGSRPDLNGYAVRQALAKHPKTPLRIALEQLKFLYVFDLVSICLQAGVPTEVKRSSEELILAQVHKLAVGQCITLAKRGTARLAASLLKGENMQIIQAVLDNPYLTETALLPVLSRGDCTPKIAEAIAAHPKWGRRYDLRIALLRQPTLPMGRALAILPDLKPQDAQALCEDPAVTPQVRSYLSNHLKRSKPESQQ